MLDSIPVSAHGRQLPSFTLRQEDVPDLGRWNVNSKHYLVLKVELVGKENTKSMGNNETEDREKIEGRFQMLNVKPLGNKPVDAKTFEKEDWERTVADVRSGKI